MFVTQQKNVSYTAFLIKDEYKIFDDVIDEGKHCKLIWNGKDIYFYRKLYYLLYQLHFSVIDPIFI